MATTEQNVRLDNLDRKILTRLMEDGRITWAQLATQVRLSAPSVTERVRKLERLGVIDGYSAQVYAEVVGYGLLAFVAVGLTDPNHHPEMRRRAAATPENPGVPHCGRRLRLPVENPLQGFKGPRADPEGGSPFHSRCGSDQIDNRNANVQGDVRRAVAKRGKRLATDSTSPQSPGSYSRKRLSGSTRLVALKKRVGS